MNDSVQSVVHMQRLIAAIWCEVSFAKLLWNLRESDVFKLDWDHFSFLRFVQMSECVCVSVHVQAVCMLNDR